MPDNNASISGIEFEIRGSANAASKSLDKFADSLGKVRSADPNSAASGVSSLADALGRLKAAVSGATASKLNKISEAIKGLGGSGAASAANNLENITASIRATQAASGNNAFGRVAKDAETIAVGTNSAAQGTAAFSESAKAASENTQKLGNTISNAQQAASKTNIKNLGDDIADASKQTGGWRVKLGELLASLKRIAMYRLIRSAIKAISAAIKEGLENAYEFSKATGGKLAQSLDRIASAGQQMKNQLGAAFGQLLIVLEPIIVALAKIITLLAEILSMFLSLFTGEFLKANDVSQAWDEASKSAKEYKRTLIGIDEINRLNGENESGDKPAFDDSGFSPGFVPPFIDTINELNKKLDEASGGFGELGDAINKIPPLLDGGRDAIRDFNYAVNEIPSFKTITIGYRVINPVPELESAKREISLYSPQLLDISFKVLSPIPQLNQLFRQIELYAQQPIEIKITVADPIPLLREIYLKAKAMFPLILPLMFSVANPIIELQRIVKEVLAFSPIVIQILLEMFDVEKVKTALAEVAKAAAIALAALGVGSIIATFGTSVATAGLVASSVSGTAAISGAYIGMAKAISGSLLDTKLAIAEFTSESAALLEYWVIDVTKTTKAVEAAFASLDLKLGQHVDSMIAKLNAFSNAVNNTPLLGDGGVGNRLRIGDGSHGKAWDSVVSYYMAPIEMLEKLFGYVGVPGFANGGFPDNGQMFIAREAGPELVGSIGNHTAVANNEQIYEGISEGVEYAMGGVIGTLNQLINVVQQIDPTVELDGIKVSRELHKYNKQVNREYGAPLAVEVGA